MLTASLIKHDSLSFMYDGKNYVATSEHPNWHRIRKAALSNEWPTAIAALDTVGALEEWLAEGAILREESDNRFVFDGGTIRDRVSGITFGAEVTTKALHLLRSGQSPKSLVNFMSNLTRNPSRVAIQESLLFFVANNMMITEDGYFIAYKSVREDYYDIHSGTVRYMVGDTVVMPRPEVDDDRTRTCSFGLHFAAYEYASTWAGSRIKHVMVVKIDPADVVSIPQDYGNQKGRTCKLVVIGERTDFTPLPDAPVYSPEGEALDYDSYDDRDEDDEATDEIGAQNVLNPQMVEATVFDLIRSYTALPDDVTRDWTLDDCNLNKRDRESLLTDLDSTYRNGFVALLPETTIAEIVEDICA